MVALNNIGRLLLGPWLILLGANHWAHFAQPIYAAGSSQELAKAFSDTGLTAVASAVLVVSGICILANRLTILALAGTISVMVAAAYWAVLTMDIQPVLAVGATLLVTAVLLLGYWPYYQQLLAMRTPSRTETGQETSLFWRRAESISRYIWGGWFIISGLFHFFTGPIIGTDALAVQLMMGLLHSGMYEVVKGVEAIGGLAVLSRRWAPLLLVINVPITFVVVYWDVLLQDPFGIIGLSVMVLTVGTTVILLRAYRDYIIPLATWAPQVNGVAEA